MLCCVYHPTDNMRVVEDVERDKLLATGVWFNTPNEAKQKRAEYERRIREGEKPRKRTRERKTENAGEPSREQ
jgi:hypothetical protein